jgi:hypothetical protein
MHLFQLFLTHYGFHGSRSHATPTQGTDYGGVAEAAGLSPLRSVTLSDDATYAITVYFTKGKVTTK